jgi:SH3-like domain-containing protein
MTDHLLSMLVLLSFVGPIVLPTRPADAGTRRIVRVKVNVAHLRARPSATAEKVRDAYENEPLRVVGWRGRWLEVRDAAGNAAWIFAPLIDGRPAIVVRGDVVNVREGPGTEHPIAFMAERGVNLLVLDRAGRWLHVRHDVGDGWLHDSLAWGLE